MNVLLARLRELADAARAGHVFGQVEVVRAGIARGLGDLHGQVVGRGAEHRELPAERVAQGRAIGHVEPRSVSSSRPRVALRQRAPANGRPA